MRRRNRKYKCKHINSTDEWCFDCNQPVGLVETVKLEEMDLATLNFLSRASDYGMVQVFDDNLFERFYRRQLRLIKRKLSKAITRIREALTLQLTLEEAICIRWTLEIWNNELPDTYAVDILRKYFQVEEIPECLIAENLP